MSITAKDQMRELMDESGPVKVTPIGETDPALAATLAPMGVGRIALVSSEAFAGYTTYGHATKRRMGENLVQSHSGLGFNGHPMRS